MSNILFDRIIDVTFTQAPQRPQRFEKIITPTFILTLCLGTRYIVRTREEESVRTSAYEAIGTIHNVPTLEDMRRGYTKYGVVYSQGDIINVLTTGARWCVVDVSVYRGGEWRQFYSGMDFGSYLPGFRLIKEYAETTQVFSINTPSSGPKPNMSFSVKQIPGNLCFNASLAIKNLVIGGFDIRSWDTMIIKAGYRNNATQFVCPIFTSYIQSPNPDGVTVFEGLTTGTVGNVLNNDLISVEFLGDNTPLRALLKEIGPALGPNVTIDASLPDKILDLPLSEAKKGVHLYGNAISLLNDIYNMINAEVTKSFLGSVVIVQLIKDSVKIYWLNGDDSTASAKFADQVISLDAVMGCSFSGPLLTVKAAWNPQLLPGDVFYMPASFYDGAKTSNLMDRSTFIDKNNLYRIVTMDVDFGTVEGNEMSITALPLMYMAENPLEADQPMKAEDLKNLLEAQHNEDGASVIHIRVGKDGNAEGPAETSTGNRLFDNNSGALAKFSSVTVSIVEDTSPVSTPEGVRNRTCLSDIAWYFYWYDPDGPKMNKKKKGKESDCGYFYLALDELKEKMNGVGVDPVEVYRPDGVAAWVVFEPLIALFTFWMHKQEENSPRNPWDVITPSTIGLIHGGDKRLLMPSLTVGYGQLEAVKDVYLDAFLTYRDSDQYRAYASMWRSVYYMLGGREVT